MRHLQDVVDEYSVDGVSDEKKLVVVEWFQKRPAERFDVTEIEAALGDELAVGQGQIRNYLTALTDEEILQSHGDRRKAYELADDIVPPVRYQVRAALRHLFAVFDIDRWGIAGVLSMSTAIWAILTLPFWVLWGSLLVVPHDAHGPISQSDYLITAIAMTLWLVVFVVATTLSHHIHRWWRRRPNRLD